MKKQDFDLKAFSKRFSELLNDSEENTHSLAKKLGLNPGTISRYANGLMAPKLPTLYAIADIFDVNPIWLFGFNAPKYENQNEDSIIKISPLSLTPHETDVINAYRDKPEMQPAVDTLLGVTEDVPAKTVKIAAYGGGVSEHKINVTDREILDALEEDDEDIFTIPSDDNK